MLILNLPLASSGPCIRAGNLVYNISCTMGLSGVLEIYHKSFCTPRSRNHKTWVLDFLYTTKAHSITILSYTTQKNKVLIFVWCNVNKEKLTSLYACHFWSVCWFTLWFARSTGNVIINYCISNYLTVWAYVEHNCLAALAHNLRPRDWGYYGIRLSTVGYGF